MHVPTQVIGEARFNIAFHVSGKTACHRILTLQLVVGQQVFQKVDNRQRFDDETTVF